MLLDKWNKAVIPKTEWKSKKKPAMGTKNMEDPILQLFPKFLRVRLKG
jgi:hypothetical protein